MLLIVQMTKFRFDIVIMSNHVCQYAAYLKSYIFYIFIIIKCICLKPIIFALNLSVASYSKVFTTFDFIFISIVMHQ